jgi:hypothetical protein
VLQSERAKRFEVGGRRENEEVRRVTAEGEMTNGNELVG